MRLCLRKVVKKARVWRQSTAPTDHYYATKINYLSDSPDNQVTLCALQKCLLDELYDAKLLETDLAAAQLGLTSGENLKTRLAAIEHLLTAGMAIARYDFSNGNYSYRISEKGLMYVKGQNREDGDASRQNRHNKA